MSDDAERARAEELEDFVRYRRTDDRRLRNELVERHRDLAVYVARRYRNRGEPLDDLVQVAMVGLLKAVERFEPERGLAFSTFATPTIDGELKRHFRDTAWSVRVPRRLQERALQLTRAVGELSQRLGRSPTVDELAEYTGQLAEEVLEAMEANRAFTASPFETGTGDEDEDEGHLGPSERLGTEDAGVADVEHRMLVEGLLVHLPPREREIIVLRFYEGLTQSQIGERMGISQMHVSRLITRALATLREHAQSSA